MIIDGVVTSLPEARSTACFKTNDDVTDSKGPKANVKWFQSSTASLSLSFSISALEYIKLMISTMNDFVKVICNWIF